ncbi:MAG: hypothetical protein AB7J13_12060, partial [Pyrinomonadaceae bacterium]
MQPNKQTVHIDRPLTNMSVAYLQSTTSFIVKEIFPIVPVDKASDKYFTFPKAAWFRDDAKPRGVGTKAASSGYDVETDNYSCEEWAHRHPIYDRVKANADNPLNLERAAVNFCARMMLQRLERSFVADFFTAGVWGTDITGVSGSPGAGEVKHWDDDTNGNPVGDVDTAKETILQNTGFEPNTMVIGYQVFNGLKESAAMEEKIKYGAGPGNPAIVTAQALAQIFGIERLLVAKSVVNTAKQGAAASMSFNFGKAAWLGYVNPNPTIEMPSAGYTFAWTGVS